MDARRLAALVMLASAIGALGGCRSPVAPSDPFQIKAADQSATLADAPGASIAQASYSESAAGESLAEQPAEDEPSAWKQFQSKLTSENIKKSAKTAVGRGPDEKVARDHYTRGDELFRAKNYADAADEFAEAAARWPDSILEEDALYMQGESLFFCDRYLAARDVFDVLLKKYENSRHLDRISARQFALGRYWEETGRDKSLLQPNLFDKTEPWFDTHGNGIKVFENIRLTDPTGPLADDAVMAQATAYFQTNRFEDAAYLYETLRKDYPQSEHQKMAHLLGLQSYLNAYQGPQYDVTPLKKADALCEQTLRNYGNQVPEERERLRQAQASIRELLAEREYDLAEYYRRLDYNRAARAHYAKVLSDYPNTQMAERAGTRLKEIENLPPDPPDYFPWLTNWLGEK